MPRSGEVADALGVIHDIGYRSYTGARLGRRHLLAALYTYRLRAIFGLGRSSRYKVVPLSLLAICCLPAVIAAAITVLTHNPGLPPSAYTYFLQVVVVLFLAAQAAQLITTDLRFRLLPLYFSRPLSRADHVWATVAAMATGLTILTVAPQVILYGGALLGAAHGPADVLSETGTFLLAAIGAIISSLVLAPLGLAAASFSRRRAFAALAVIAPYLVATTTFVIIQGVTPGSVAGSLAGLLSPFDLLQGVQVWLLGGRHIFAAVPGPLGPLYPLGAAAAASAAAAVLLARFRRIDL